MTVISVVIADSEAGEFTASPCIGISWKCENCATTVRRSGAYVILGIELGSCL